MPPSPASEPDAPPTAPPTPEEEPAPPAAEEVPRAQALRLVLNVTAGSTVTLPVRLVAEGHEGALEVRVEGLGGILGTTWVQPAGETRPVAFILLEVPPDVPEGAVPLGLVVSDGVNSTRVTQAAILHVVAPAPGGFHEGDVALVRYTGRNAETGDVFNTNDPLLRHEDFTRMEGYLFSEALFLVETTPRPNVVMGLYEGLLGMHPGESRAIFVPPGLAYGPREFEDLLPREEALEREHALPLRPERLERARFDDLVAAEGEDPDAVEAGSRIHLTSGPNRWPVLVLEKGDEEVVLRIDPRVNDTYTFHPAWPHGSRVVEVNETLVRLFETPTTGPEEPFTHHAHFPGMSAVVAVNDTLILMRHTPPVGHVFELAGETGRPPVHHRVDALDDQWIHVTVRNDHPLAGIPLTFDVELLEIRRAP